ncbi:MAG: protein kinase [Vicinamibacterales bacterium]
MALTVGSRVGVYEVTGRLGAGGMGEVYRGHDTRLNRDVALKVLLPAVANDPDRLARFGREAQVLASLNHPNIAHVHGLEDAGDTRALVMELVEGPTLADRLTKGALPLDEVMPIATQIAEALEAAHEQGIIHRDLKPANVKVRDDGTVKVLDFGLAKAVEAPGASSAGPATESPTFTSPAMTQAGVILGTAAYMSPEQAKGRPVDKRSDVWAFGCVLYEMLAGARPFEGEDMTDVLGAVVRLEPDWARLPATTPPPIRALVQGCLVKDRRHRVGDVAAALFVLRQAASAPSSAAGVAATRGASARRAAPVAAASLLAGALLAAGLGAALFGLGVVGSAESAVETPITRFAVSAPEAISPSNRPAISPDGRRLVFRADNELWMRALDALSIDRLPGTEGAVHPFWSPDSRSVGFFAAGKLKRLDLGGGPPVTLCDVGVAPGGGTWSPEGVIVFAPDAYDAALQQVPSGGGVPTPATRRETAVSGGHAWPQFLPDGRHFLYTAYDTTGGLQAVVLVGSLDVTAGTPLDVRGASTALYARQGALLYPIGTTLMRQAFDVTRLTLSGDPAPVADNVAIGPGGLAIADVSHTGTLVYTTAVTDGQRQLVWVDRHGRVTPLPLPPGVFGEPGLSPDGRQIALSITDATGTHIWVYDTERGTLGKRTFAAHNQFPLWSLDGRELAYSTNALRGPLMKIRADGSGQPVTLVADGQRVGIKVATSWSPDGSELILQSDQDVFVRRADGSLHPLVATPASEREGRLAPGGRWLAYSSTETGRREVYVQSYPTGNGKWQISTDGGAQPMWAPGGGELFYKSGNRMMVVPVDAEAGFKAGAPRLLFEMPQPERTPGDPARFVVSPDASRFLILTTAPGDEARTTLTVVLNWPATIATAGAAR